MGGASVVTIDGRAATVSWISNIGFHVAGLQLAPAFLRLVAMRWLNVGAMGTVRLSAHSFVQPFTLKDTTP